MLKNILFFFAILSLLFVAPQPCFANDAVLPKTVRITTSDWPPFTSTTGKGIYSDIVNDAFAEIGITPEYVYYPWRRGEKNVASGKIWCIFPYTINVERSALYLFSEPLNESSTDIFYYGPDKEYVFEKIADLK